jgi:hypothetical protein
MTLSFVTTAHPRKLLDYLRREYRFEIREGRPGIYYVEEGTFAVQIIESKRLEGGSGGIGLRDLRGGLNEEELWAILEKSKRMPEGAPLSAYLDVLAAANRSGLRGMMKMQNASDVIEEIVKELGLTERWEAKLMERAQMKALEKARKEVREESQREAVRKLQRYGMESQQIAEALELPQDMVFRYLETT